MKRVIIFIVCLTSIVLSHGQELTVKTFRIKTNDLAASTNERKDVNGNSCALIKVQLLTEGAQFAPNVIGNVEYKVNEYWVYLPTISKHLEVKHPNYLTKDIVFSEYGINKLESKITYELILTIPDGLPHNQVVSSQYLVFYVEPKDAIIEVDGELWSNNDGIARKFVPFGDYQYSVQSKDYHSVSSSISVNDPNNKVIVNVKLSPAFGTLSIPAQNNLNGATVYIDNNLAGKVPLTAERIASGNHSIRIVKPLYKSFDGTITIFDGETTTYTPELVANYSAVTLTVDNGAEIWINDENKGVGSWTGNLEYGDYKIETKKDSHHSQSKIYSILASSNAQSIKLDSPTPIYGSLNITATPEGGEIILDGNRIGDTPMFLQQVLIGEHEIKINKENFVSYTQTVTVNEGQTSEINCVLENIECVYISAGELSNKLDTVCEKIERLPISGTMNASDFYFIRTKCKKLKNLDLSQVKTVPTIVFVSGNTVVRDEVDFIIPRSALLRHPTLEIITLPTGFKRIEDYAFYELKKLVKINIPEGVETIGNYAFSRCYSLQSIELPSSLSRIGTWAFLYCGKLSKVYINAKYPPKLGENVFQGISITTDATLFVPNGSESLYENSEWSRYFTIKTQGEL